MLQIAAYLGMMGFLGIVPALTMLCSGTETAPVHRCGKPDPKQMLTGISRVLQQSGFEVESEKSLPGPLQLSYNGCFMAYDGVGVVIPSSLRLKEQL